MSRGRKSKSGSITQDWEQIFQKNIDSYFQILLVELGKIKNWGNENSLDLFNQIQEEKLNQKSIFKKNHIEPIKSEEIPFKLPENWLWCRLKDICGNITDGTHQTPTYFDDGVVFLSSKNVTSGKIDWDNVKYIDQKQHLEMHKRVAPKLNDILLAKNGTTGVAAIVDKDIVFDIYVSLALLRPLNGITPKYLLYFINSKIAKSQFNERLRGIGVPNLHLNQIREVLTPLPPISEQERIVEFFDDFKDNNLDSNKIYFNNEIEQKIIKLHKSQLLAAENFTLISEQLTLIENLNQAILQEAVQGKLVPQDPTDEPASQLLERIKAEKAKTGKKEKPLPPIKPEEIPFEIPENWVWCRLGEILSELKYGTSKSCNYDSNKNSKVLRIPNVSGEKLNKDDLKFTDLDENEKNDLSLIENDILIVRSNGSRELVGKTVLITPEFTGYAYAGYLIRLRYNVSLCIPSFLLCVTKSPFVRKLIENPLRSTVGINNINTEEISKLLIPLPPLSEQQRIVAEIEKQLSKTKELKAHIIANQQATEQLLKALLHGAFEVEEREEKIV